MHLFKLFKKNQAIPANHTEFWEWFTRNQGVLYRAIRNGQDVERQFLDRVFAKLININNSIYLLAGMCEDRRAEVVFSPDGSIANIVFTEELVAAAPQLKRWKFTALKPAIKDVSIDYSDHVFSAKGLSFSVMMNPEYPDEINLSVIYPKYEVSGKDSITNGIMIFLDNFLGELKTVTVIDSVEVVAEADEGEEIIPMEKLPDYLIWREKEFVEKYEGRRKNTQSDRYVTTTVELPDGLPLTSLYNSDLLDWDAKCSHQWIVHIEIEYESFQEHLGMPDTGTYAVMEEFEQHLMQELQDADGYLNVGRETGSGLREIFFACKEFRHSSRKVSEVIAKFAGTLSVFYSIYKDKYWKSLERFRLIEDEDEIDEEF